MYGLDALVADYRVEGRYAETIERYFVEAAKMPALGFYCCGWDSIRVVGRDGWLRDGVTSYEISMGSGETLLNRREDWPRIPWFSGRVTRYLEEPEPENGSRQPIVLSPIFQVGHGENSDSTMPKGSHAETIPRCATFTCALSQTSSSSSLPVSQRASECLLTGGGWVKSISSQTCSR